MHVTEYTSKRVNALNKMSFPELTLPVNLKILWIETVDEAFMRSGVLKQLHEHSFFEIHFVFSGEITYECDGEIIPLRCGQAILIPAHITHRYIRASSDILKTAIAFSVDKSALELLQLKDMDVKSIDFADEVIQGLNFILKQSEISDLFTPSLIAGRTMEILYAVFQNLHLPIPEIKRDSCDPRFLVAKAFIENNSNRIISCDDVARECCLSTRQLSRVFKTETGSSPSEYIILTKVKRAKKLLLDKRYTIKEVSFLLGFENESSFVSFFKRHCAMPPGTFRKEMSEK